MASACINNIALSPKKFLDRQTSFSSFGWFSPRMSPDRVEEVSRSSSVKPTPHSPQKNVDSTEVSDKEFEFPVEDPVKMLPADELFSDGKLMPLQLSAFQPAESWSENRLLDTAKVHQSCEIVEVDPYLFSPRAPSCASRWKELLGMKRLYHQNNAKQDNQKMSSSGSGINCKQSLKHLLHRSSKSSPVDSERERVSISCRLSLSSSSCGHDDDSLPRLSLDLDKHTNLHKNSGRIRLVKHREGRISKSPLGRQVDNNITGATLERGVSVDSPRINSSGKIVFHTSLERSWSSPSSFNGAPQYKQCGVERSYSANVRVTPVLNLPVSSKSGSVFGFPLFSAPSHKRDCCASCGNSSRSHNHQRVAATTKRIDVDN